MTTPAREARLSDRVAILDAGSQYGKVIDRRVRELNVETELFPLDVSVESLRGLYTAVIIGGGPQSVYSADAPTFDPRLFTVGVPVLGICYGMQLMNMVHGGAVEKRQIREDGQFSINVTAEAQQHSPLFTGLGAAPRVLLTHGDSVTTVAPGFQVTARSHELIVAAIEDRSRGLYGVQFHPEVDLTECGSALLRNFLFNIAGCTGTFTPVSRQELAMQYIRRSVDDRSKVLVLVSGGVDSSVCAALLKAALPADRIIALHIDNGFMRLNESNLVVESLRALGLNLTCIDATHNFAEARTKLKDEAELSERLCDSVRPEVKRQIIGDTFVHVANQAIAQLGLNAADVYLAQGTLRPDLIESANAAVSANADVIKTHHNDTALVRELRNAGRIIEPLADYHKDEVRALGQALGLPRELVWRQPFPGPGLAVRLLCTREPFMPAPSDPIHQRLAQFAAKHPLFSFSLLPVRSVGVQGDGRSYCNAVAMSCDRVVTEQELAAIDWSAVAEIAKALPASVHGVNRVVFAFGDRLPSDVSASVTESYLRPESLEQLRLADDIVNRILLKYGLVRTLAQVPVISVPANLGQPGCRCICIRPFVTSDFMTGVPAIPGSAGSTAFPLSALAEIIDQVEKVPNVARVLLDLTPKPPGTTEWE